MSELSLRRRGFMLVLSSPSGAGKTTISRLLLERDAQLTMSVSCTTRAKRPNESEGRDYFFLSQDDFKLKIETDYFFEHAEVFGHYYGTPRQFVLESLLTGRDVLFDIDWQGTRRLTLSAREDVVSIFILPPSMEELARRLTARAQDSQSVIDKRMARASDEISHWDEYDYVIINDSLDHSLEKVLSILRAERMKRLRQVGMADFVSDLVGYTR